MRALDRDLIRGGHYGQRSREPHSTGRTHGCSDHCCTREESSCQPGAVHTWPKAAAIGTHSGRLLSGDKPPFAVTEHQSDLSQYQLTVILTGLCLLRFRCFRLCPPTSEDSLPRKQRRGSMEREVWP